MKMQAVMVGTLFEQEEIDKKKNFYNIAARDEQGRKHFEGAFTGGFSAGYKGTCGSKAGWAPATFISSRSQRFKGNRQTIMDFMDDEDLGANVAGETITAKDEYDTLGDKNRSLIEKEMGSSLLGPVPEELVVASRTSIGYEVLKNMGGLRKGKIQAKEESKAKNKSKIDFEDYAEDEFSNIEKPHFPIGKFYYLSHVLDIPQPKNNFYGVSYVENQKEDDEYENVFNNVFKKYANKEVEEEEESTQKKKNNNKVFFNPADLANDEEDEIFADEKYSKFVLDNLEAADDETFAKAKFKRPKKSALEGFIKESQHLHTSSKKYANDPIPENWDPFSKVREYMKKNNLTTQGTKRGFDPHMNPSKRAAMLGEEFETEKDILGEKLALISEETKRKIIGVTKFVKGEKQEMGGDDLNMIFQNDKEKIERYKMFLWEKAGKLVSGIPPGRMTYEDLKNEKVEFEQVYQMYHKEKTAEESKPKADDKQMTEEEKKQAELIKRIEELKKTIEKQKTQRKIEHWLPDRLLCRRFNVAQPNTERLIEQEKTTKDKFHEEILPAFMENKFSSNSTTTKGYVPTKKIASEPKFVPVNKDNMLPTEFKSNKMEREIAFANQEKDNSDEEEPEEEEEPQLETKVTEDKPPMDLFKSIFDADSDDE